VDVVEIETFRNAVLECKQKFSQQSQADPAGNMKSFRFYAADKQILLFCSKGMETFLTIILKWKQNSEPFTFCIYSDLHFILMNRGSYSFHKI
jgi:hypothetical protein